MTRTLALTPAQTLALTLTAAVALAVALPLGYRYDAAVVVDGPNDGGIDIRLWRRRVPLLTITLTPALPLPLT